MKIKIKEFTLFVDEMAIIIGILCFIFSSIRQYFENYFVCYLFIVFHELSHMFIASICGIKTKKITIRISGLCVNLDNYNCKGLKWLIIYLVGPISNIVLASIFKNVPMVYGINIGLAILNLIPISPLDGYNIMVILFEIFNIKNKEIIQKIICLFILILLVLLGVYQFIFLKNPSIILMAFYIFIQGQIARKNNNLRLYQEYYKNVTNFN